MGRTTSFTYTVRGQPIQTTYPDGTTEYNEYNANGSLAKHTAVNGITTVIAHDECLRPDHKSYYDAQGNYLYHTKVTYQGDLVASETDANGVTTTYQYDGAGRLIQTCIGDRRTTIEYDSLGRRYKTMEWIDQAHARITIQEYDLLNRVIEERVEDIAGTVFQRNQYGYDRCGNRSSILKGNTLTQITYDSRNRPVCITDALGYKTVTEYEETTFLRITETDPLGRQTISTYDALGRLSEVQRKDPLGQLSAQRKYFYDLAGQKVRQEDTALAPGLPSHQVVTEWQYDQMGRLAILTKAVGSPEQKCTSYSYNQYGQKECIYLPDGTQLKHQYDSLGRLQRYQASDNSFDYTYTYDKNHNLLSAIDAQNNKTERTYDRYNQIIKEQLANGLILHYTYDRLGRLACIELPDNTGIAYSYDAVHLKTVKRLSNTPYEHSYTQYDLSGNLLEEQAPCGKVTYEWNPLNKAKAIRSKHFTEEMTSYDPVGNLLQKHRQQHTHCKYTYDALNQLKTENITGLKKHEYLYDSLNNRRKLDGVEHTVNHLNQLLSDGNTTYTYDAKGHLIGEQSPTTHAQYTYDALGRLTSLTSNGETYTYQYDAFNRRIKKIAPQGEERYLYIDQNEIGMVNSRDALVQLRVLGSGKGAEIGSAIALELEDQVYLPIHDHAGNISVLVDLQTQQAAESYTYSAFGKTKREGTPVPNPWFFSSKRFDRESGWIYFGRRYYDPNTGRWTTPDPLGFADGPNLYAYVHNNPLTHFDLYGLRSEPLSGHSGVASGVRCESRSAPSRSASGGSRHSQSGCSSTRGFDGGRDEGTSCTHHHANQSLQNASTTNPATPVLPQTICCYEFDSLIDNRISRVCHLGRPEPPGNIRIVFINGINNTFEEALESAVYLSDLSGGYNVYLVYNATHGTSVDTFECAIGLDYISTTPVEVLHQTWNAFFGKADSGDATILQICHSQGCIHTRNALLSYDPALREKIQVLAIAPAAYVYKETCAEMMHYRAGPWRDFVPRIDKEGALREREYIIDLGSHPKAPLFDHGFRSPTYKKSLKTHTRQFIQSRGATF